MITGAQIQSFFWGIAYLIFIIVIGIFILCAIAVGRNLRRRLERRMKREEKEKDNKGED